MGERGETMNELLDRCEHCGNLNRRGALHCDRCGKGLSANLTARRKECTWKGLFCLIVCVVSVIAAVVLHIAAGSDYGGLLSFLSFMSIGIAIISMFYSIKFFWSRGKYKYSENIELTLTGEMNESGAANTSSRYAPCPSCGNPYHRRKAFVCKYCGYDLKNQTGKPGKSRLNDEKFMKSMEHYSKRAKVFFLSSLPAIVLAIFALSIGGNEFTAYSAVGIILILVFFLLFAKGITSAGTATEIFKVNVVRDALSEIIDDCVYRSKLSISQQRIEETEMFSSWNKFHGNDYIRGMYRGHQIELSDIWLEEEYEEGSGKNSKTVTRTIFRGQWITCSLGKKLPAVIRLKEGSKKGNVETENIAFNKKYAIYTDDPHYMFYVLTPHFMEYIVTADEMASSRTFFYFSGDRVHIAVDNGHDAFEIPASRAARSNPSKAREEIKKEMKYITDILDELLLNESLF